MTTTTASSILNTPSVFHRRAAVKDLLDPPARPPRRTCSVQTLSALATSCPADFPLSLPSCFQDIFRLLEPRLLAATSSFCDRRVSSSSSTATSARLPRIRDLFEEDDNEDFPPCKRLKMRPSTTLRW